MFNATYATSWIKTELDDDIFNYVFSFSIKFCVVFSLIIHLFNSKTYRIIQRTLLQTVQDAIII